MSPIVTYHLSFFPHFLVELQKLNGTAVKIPSYK